MGDVKRSQIAPTTTITDDDYIDLYRSVTGILTDYKIKRTDNEADIYTAIALKKEGAILRLYNQNATFTQAFAADTKIDAITIRYVSGTPIVKIGETIGSDQIMLQDTIVSGIDYNVGWGKSYPASQTLYFTLTGGVIHVTIEYTLTIIGTP